MKINYAHLPVKMHYFFFMGAMGAIIFYIPVYAKQLGVSPLIIGSILAILPSVTLICKVMVGYAADYFLTWRKAIFVALFAISGISYVLMYFLPALPGPMLPDHPFQNISCEYLLPCDMNHQWHHVTVRKIQRVIGCEDIYFSIRLSFHTTEKEAVISSETVCLLNIDETSLCQRNVTINYNCNVTCDNFENNQCLYTSITFWIFVILMFFGNVSCNISMSISDTICFDTLGENERNKYGKQRLWGSIGFSLIALLSGYTIDLWSYGKVHKIYTPAFILVLLFICIDLICCRKLKLPLRKSPNIFKDVYIILKAIPIIIFLCTVVLVGVLETLMFNFLFWYIEDFAMATGYMNEVKLIEGLSLFIAFGSKVIFFFMSGNILEKFGYGYTVTFCFLCYALRIGLVTLVPTPWYIVLVEGFLEGPTFSLFYTTIVTYANVISPPGTSATVQAIAAGLKDGPGYMIGNFLAGFLFKEVGSKVTFRIYSGLAALFAFVYIIIYVSYLKHTTVDIRNNVEWRKPDDAQEHCVDAQEYCNDAQEHYAVADT